MREQPSRTGKFSQIRSWALANCLRRLCALEETQQGAEFKHTARHLAE